MHEKYYDGYTTCYDKPIVYVLEGTYISTFMHEYLHAVDCADNGYMDGSLYPGDKTHKDLAHLWVYWAMVNPVEATKQIEQLRK
jgi:hypothetical protein